MENGMSSLNLPIEPKDLTPAGRIFGAPAAPGSPNVRERLAIFDRLCPIKGATFADVGGGSGSYAAELITRCSEKLVLIDIIPHHITAARKGLSSFGDKAACLLGTAEDTKLNSEAFDCAFLIEMLDHVDEVLPCLLEARRILKPGGRLYISVPNRLFPFEIHPVKFGSRFVHPLWAPFLPWVKSLHDRHATARVFTQRGLRALAEQAGFVGFRADYLMPPFERLPALRGFSKAVEKTPAKVFGVSICSVMVKK
jgi:ubiquinone/menaquinone biosynthesis C-methylase UbiE